MPSESVTLTAPTQCPTSPNLTSTTRSLCRQGRALGETAALQGSGDAGQVATAQVQGSFRQGLCPYLAQATKNAPGDWSALDLLREGLEQKQLDPVDFLHQVHQQYGPSVQVGDVVFESRHDVAQQILTATDPKHGDRDFFSKSALQSHGMGDVYGNESLFLLSDQRWSERRQLLQPFFTGHQVLSEAKHSEILETVDRHMQQWPVGQPVDLGAKLRELTLDVAVQHMFGQQLSPEELDRSARLFEQAGTYVTNGVLGRGEACPAELRSELDRWAEERLAGRRAGEPRADMLQALLDHSSDRQTLRDEILTMAMLGHETTANLLSWTVAELARHPEAVSQIREEYGSEIGSARPTLEQSQDLGEVRSAVKESTRLHAPNYLVSREVTRDITLDGPQGQLDLRKGMQVLIPIQEVNRDVESGAAENWDPERPGSRLYSFGGGFRVCLGQVLARMESQVVLSQLVERFEFRPVDPGAPQPQSDFSTHPKNMEFVLTPRQPGRV